MVVWRFLLVWDWWGGSWICVLVSFIIKTTRRFTCQLFKHWLNLNFSSLFWKQTTVSVSPLLNFYFSSLCSVSFINSLSFKSSFSMSNLWLCPPQQRATRIAAMTCLILSSLSSSAHLQHQRTMAEERHLEWVTFDITKILGASALFEWISSLNGFLVFTMPWGYMRSSLGSWHCQEPAWNPCTWAYCPSKIFRWLFSAELWLKPHGRPPARTKQIKDLNSWLAGTWMGERRWPLLRLMRWEVICYTGKCSALPVQ